MNDTLVGYRSMSGDPAQPEDQVVRIAVADIESMQVRQANAGGTGLVVLVIVLFIPSISVLD